MLSIALIITYMFWWVSFGTNDWACDNEVLILVILYTLPRSGWGEEDRNVGD